MKKLSFTIDIKAPKEKVWHSLWDEENYQSWTSVFCEGSYTVSDWNEGSKIYFNLFDNIVIKEDAERPYAIAQFGEILSNAIIQKKLISITSASYDVLDNNLSKIICYAIKREQIANQETRVNEYSYTYFQKIVRFKLKNKKKKK